MPLNSPPRSHAITRFLTTLLALLLFSATGRVMQAQGWQQSVTYRMQVSLDVEQHILSGRQELLYRNNSPDTLREVWYHLFYNAFKPGSLMDQLDQQSPLGPQKGISELRPSEQGDVQILWHRQDGKPLQPRIDGTLMRVPLASPLSPGDSTTLSLEFRTQIPLLRRRAGRSSHEGIDYSMAQWYPKLAEYDQHGWHSDPYVNREFYGVYGTFDVELTLPGQYIVGATGTLLNPAEVLGGYEVNARDTLIEYPKTREGDVTWRFRAENVHDFAWVADPDYAHQITRWQGRPVHLLYHRRLIASWQNVSYWTTLLLDYYSDRFGIYDYPGFTVAQAGDGGMEYPQLVMITGYRTPRSLFNVLAHEIAHQWFYGMIGTNEVQQAWLDEGLTNYATDEAALALLKEPTENPHTGVERIVEVWDETPWRDIYSYYSLATRGYSEPLDLFHDHYREEATAALPYYKGEAVIRQLEYLLGREALDRGLKLYTQMWTYRHPDARDFERAMERAGGVRLDWFFNQWIEGDGTLDYSINGLSSVSDGGGFLTTIDLRNEAEIVMPIAVDLEYEDGSAETAWIPIDDYVRPGSDLALPVWHWMNREYSATFQTKRKVVRAEIGAEGLLADLDRTNNVEYEAFPRSLFPAAKAAFWKRWDLVRPHDFYSIRLRPILWYSAAEGAQLGLTADGGYTFERYEAEAALSWNSKTGRWEYRAAWDSPIDFLGRLTRLQLLGTNADGARHFRAGLQKEIKPFYWDTPYDQFATISASHRSLIGASYPNALSPWDSGSYNTISLGYRIETASQRDLPFLRGHVEFEGSLFSTTPFSQWRGLGEGLFDVAGYDLGLRLFAGATAGDSPAQWLFDPASSRSVAIYDATVQRLVANLDPGLLESAHFTVPAEGRFARLIGAPKRDRLVRHLLSLELTVDGFDPLDGMYGYPWRHIEVMPYAAAGWAFPYDPRLDEFTLSSLTTEAGIDITVDLFDLLLPQEWQDLIGIGSLSIGTRIALIGGNATLWLQ